MRKAKIFGLCEQLDEIIDLMHIEYDNGNLNRDFYKFKAVLEGLAIAMRKELKGEPYNIIDYYAIREQLAGGEE